MSYAISQADRVEYAPCRYGASKLTFRGPKTAMDKEYLVAMGATETFGRFVERPFCDRLKDSLKMPVINLGCQNAGIDAFFHDPDVMSLAKGARLTILQVMGAANMSNRLYRVHPRRNDRFLGPSATLKTLYHEVDFTDFSFTRHMLTTLFMISPERFAVVQEELRQAWRARMRSVLQTIDAPVLLLWLRNETPCDLGIEPLFIEPDMVADIAERCLGVEEVRVQSAGRDLDQMVVGPMQHAQAAHMLNGTAHQAIADQLSTALTRMDIA